ncbi:IS982 family transposase [Bacteroides heparinolyticus]|uniref:IS982 family transposase n=1 Tax=Prevotella heparinolytica TaxID=28113 RepID=UPI0023F86D10|nr:IS982 family transposase [Bacteroides heparinolyticus]MCI6211771.1 IS982 family transposase [Bacteroides heparinolyticus]
MTDTNLLEIFCIFDEFCKYFTPKLKKHSLEVSGNRHRNRPCRMSDSEIMTILVLFHTRRFRDLKSFYLGYVCRHLRKDFPHTISYNRFVERQAQVAMQLLLFLQTCALGKCTGISIIDSTPLVSCHIKRERQHRTMRGWAQKGKCSMGWFYGFKLHIVINDKGEIIQWQLTPGNINDREPLKDKRFTDKLFGKLFADRGYISQDIFEELFIDELHLITKLRKNMKNSLMNLYDKILLRKRTLIETVNDELKNVCHIEHTRHRSVENFVTNLLAGLIAYNLLPKKPSMNIDIIDKSRLIA